MLAVPERLDVWSEPSKDRVVEITEFITPLTPTLGRMIEEGEWIRASQHSICEKCGEKFSKHPSLEQNDWLNVLCDGTLVKL